MSSRIVPLQPAHRRDAFDCGDAALNDFIRRYARQQQERDFSRTYVVLDDDDAGVIGFVSVSAGQVGASSFPEHSKLPRYPVPVMRIGRLAVDRRAQGGKLGHALLRFALELAVGAAGRVGIHAVVVDAKNEAARAFYEHLGFVRFLDAPMSLFLPVRTLRDAVGHRPR